jgi:hypothetical protein
MTDASVYDTNAPKLVERGFYPLPIVPGTKTPGHWIPSLGRYVKTVGWTDIKRPVETSPQPGAGTGLRLGLQPDGTYTVALDWDHEGAALMALDKFPATVMKEGRRGLTLFYRSKTPVPSHDIKIDGVVVVQILGEGRQTVLPPTIHPDTRRPYTWGSKFSLYDIKPGDLVELPDDYRERMEAILRPLGYEPDPEKPSGNGHDDDEGNPFRDLNKLAMRELAKWVPDLGLHNLKRNRGPHASYTAVATWRPSTTGRPLEERKNNLSISGAKGIKDFGNGDTFSPIDLVMRARSCSRSDAMAWLQERLQPDSGIEIDFEAIISPSMQPGREEPKEEPKEEAREQAKAEGRGRKERFQFTPFWEMRLDMEEQAYLIDDLIPSKGIVLLWGPPKCLKSFLVLDLMFHVAKGWEYRDRVVRQGAVVICAFEGRHTYPKRVVALRRHHELDDKTDKSPIHIMSGKTDLVRDHALLVQKLGEHLGRWGVAQPAAVVLDTLNKSLVGSESKDLDMAAYIRAAEAVRDAFDCVVIIVHHCGWDESRMRGHSSLRGAVDAEISVTREGDVAVATVEEMRDGPDGVQIASKVRIVDCGEDKSGRPCTSLVLVPHEPDGSGVHKEAAAGKSRWPKALKVFRDAMLEATLMAGVDHQIEVGPRVKAVDLGTVRTTFYALYVVAGDEAASSEMRQNAKRMAFIRSVEKARASNLIGARAFEDGRQLVWLVHPESNASGA